MYLNTFKIIVWFLVVVLAFHHPKVAFAVCFLHFTVYALVNRAFFNENGRAMTDKEWDTFVIKAL